MNIYYKIHHISINVKSLSDSFSFYKKLGFRLVYKYIDDQVEIYHLLNGFFIIELFYYKNYINLQKIHTPQNHSNEDIGYDHFSLCVDNIELAFKELKKYSETKSPIIGRTGITYFFIKDPNNVRIEIVEDKRNFL